MTFPRFSLGVLAAAAAALVPVRAEPGHVFPALTGEEQAAIAAAVPARARANPARPRSILVFYRTEGYVHGSIPYANEAFRLLGERTGAFRADFSDDMAVFTPARLAAYDAVVFQNTTGLAFKDPAARAALLSYVAGGRGFVGVHAATDSFYTWPEAQDMIGGLFHDHPWKSIDEVGIKVDEPGHPLVAAFGGRGFWLREEIYQIMGPYRRDRERVLLSLDMSKIENWRSADKIARTDADFPIAWVRSFGRGRVFYTSIGHNPNIFSVPELLQFYLDGIQFALGDLPAPSAPLAKLPAAGMPPVPALPLQDRGYPKALSPDAFEKLAQYNFGPDKVPVIAIDLYLRAHGAAVHPAVEKSLLGLLARPNLPDGARDYTLRTLGAIGSAASVPAVEAIIGDARFGPLAVMTLFQIPGPECAKALVGALGTARGAALQSAMNACGRRHLGEAVPRLASLAASADTATAAAALASLGDMGTGKALDALEKASVPKELEVTRAWAEVDAARHISAHSSESDVELGSLYRGLFTSTLPDPVRIAALQGLERTGGPASLPDLELAFKDPSPRVREAAANLFALAADAGAIEQAASEFHGTDPLLQRVLLEAFDSRRPADALPLFTVALEADDPGVRVTALRGLGDTGHAEAIPLLINHLAGLSAESAAATDSLGRLTAHGTVAALLAATHRASPVQRTLILNILGARADHRVFPLALSSAGDTDPAVRAAAYAAIAATSRPEDLSTVLSLLSRARTAAERRSMEHALLGAVRASAQPDAIVDAINRTLAHTRGPARGSLLIALALAGTDHARAILAGILHGSSAQDRREVIRAVTGSRNPALESLVLDSARTAPDPSERILALRGYLDLLQVPNGRSDDELCAAYATAWSLSRQDQEKDAIIAALRELKSNAGDAEVARLQATRARH
jgi:type 1 glutamine amidotransferase/HEAT repeat protein